jgi:small nuclear ribonucleoprotein B and B'
MSTISKASRLLGLVNFRLRVTLLDGRQLVGRFLAFDRHMNLVLGDADEFRRLPPKKGVAEADRQIRRPLGLVLVRGEEVVSLAVEGPPPNDDRRGKRDVAPVRSQARALGFGRPC